MKRPGLNLRLNLYLIILIDIKSPKIVYNEEETLSIERFLFSRFIFNPGVPHHRFPQLPL